MALPKKKVSKSRRDKRRANWKVEAPALVVCPQCHEPKAPHRACPHCGYYRGRKAVTVSEKGKGKAKAKR